MSDNTINLVSTYADQQTTSGPGKVFQNLVKGLVRIGQSYVVNRALDSARRLWIHSDLRALLELPRRGTLNVLGPNLVVFPRDLPTGRPFTNSLYLQPSQWAVDLWKQEQFHQCPLRAWPIGIDTYEWLPRKKGSIEAPVLIYYKERFPQELLRLQDVLKKLGVNYKVLTYGNYIGSEYITRLHECSYVIWLGCHESQGIALQEALAADVPILVLNALSLFDVYSTGKQFPERLRSFRTSTAPYFDSRCGIILESLDHLEHGISMMHERFANFRPRAFVLEHLSLEKQAREFVAFFEELKGMNDCGETERRPGDNRPYLAKMTTRLRLKMFHAARRVLK